VSEELFPQDRDAALQRLLAGNARFVDGTVRDRRQVTAHRAQVASGQRPFAVVLTCSDSRVPPELIFDQGIGDLFVVRVAGNTAADALILGSVEFAVDVLGSVLVFVLGHSGCGAVTAAVDVTTSGVRLPGDIAAVVAPIIPAVEAVRGRPDDDLLGAATRENVHRSMEALAASRLLSDRVSAGTLLIAGGEYELATGKVERVA
jgi:carbonic anhydrase